MTKTMVLLTLFGIAGIALGAGTAEHGEKAMQHVQKAGEEAKQIIKAPLGEATKAMEHPAGEAHKLEKQHEEHQMRNASALMGHRVENPQGENLGRISDLIVDTMTGQISEAVISYGGVVGVSESRVRVPWSKLQLRGERDVFLLNMRRNELEEHQKKQSAMH